MRIRIAAAVQNRPEESYFSRLDSSIKKNTAFVRKLKNFTEAQKESILKDIQVLNLTKYISEVANAVSKQINWLFFNLLNNILILISH